MVGKSVKVTPRYVLILGGNFDNAGDHLMLGAATKALHALLPQVRIVSNILGLDTYEDRAALRLYQRIWSNKGLRLAALIGKPVLRRYGRAFGIIPDEMISGVLDMSGYAYADRWGLSVIRARSAEYHTWKRRGVPVIMLPQAFGPFDNLMCREAMRRLLQSVDLVYARDEISYQTVCSLAQDLGTTRVRRGEEFTQSFDVSTPPCEFDLQRSVVLVPNVQMLRQSKGITWSEYLDFWVRIATCVQEMCLQPLLVQFSRSADADVVNALWERARFAGVIRSSDPWFLKGIVAGAVAAICSRYHSLVCALSQGVPAASTAWSHKYTEFLRDYGLDWALLSVNAGQEEIRGVLQRLIGDRDVLVANLRRQRERVQSSINAMWQEIGKLLGTRL